MRIGPVILFLQRTRKVRFPYVPAGRHGIWFLRANQEIRVGEVEVRAGNEIRHELTLSGTAVLRGRPDPYGESAAELRRPNGQVVAREAGSSSDFAFIGLQPGSYLLVLGERRIPVQLAYDQDLDLGILR